MRIHQERKILRRVAALTLTSLRQIGERLCLSPNPYSPATANRVLHARAASYPTMLRCTQVDTEIPLASAPT